mgnify:CR=1 FL=1
MLVDPDCACLERFHPAALVDAILAKKETWVRQKIWHRLRLLLVRDFTAGTDCDAVIETMRGHRLGRVIYEGSAIAIPVFPV